MSNYKYLALIGAFVATPAIAEDALLCHADELPIFSCTVPRHKAVALCRSNDKSHITYRFGSSRRIELEHKDIIGDKSSFFYGQLRSNFTNYVALGFKRGNYKYEIYREMDRESGTTDYSVIVISSSQDRPSVIPCISDIKDHSLGTTTDVSCDPNETLGCTIDDMRRKGYVK